MNSERCSQCKHFIIANAGEGKIYGCDRSKCVFEPTTKNDLGVDLISRADLYNRIKGIDHDEDYECDEFGGSRITYHTCDWDEVLREIEDAPSVTPQPTKNDLEVDWESYKDADGNSLDYLILNVLQNNFDCGDAYGYTVADKIIGLLPSVAPLSSGLDKNSKKLEKDFGELDCVDRAELLKAMDTWDKFGYTETGCFVREPKGDYVPYVHYEDMVNCVKNMPPVTPQQRKGHWIEHGIDESYAIPVYTCSKCDHFIGVVVSDFCPSCGADMRGEE